MQAYILNSHQTISPFGRPARDMKVHNVPLGEHQQAALERAGFSVERIDTQDAIRRVPALVVRDNLYFTDRAVRNFVKAARQVDGNSRAAIACSLLTEQMVPELQAPRVEDADGRAHRVYDCYYLRQIDSGLSTEQRATHLPIPHRLTTVRNRASRQLEPSGRFVTPVSAVCMFPIRHWSGVLAANLLGMPGFLLSTLQQHPIRCGLLPLKILLRAGSFRPSRLISRSYLAGTGCRVAVSAHVEASVLGRRVRVGPSAVVTNSVLGNGVEVRAGAVVEGCTLSRDVVVEPGARLRGCVADEGATLAMPLAQLSLFGRDSVACPGSGTADFVLHGTVKTTVDGNMVSTGSKYLGSCLGDGAFIGPMVHLMAGVEIPNDCRLVLNPRTVVRNVDTGLPSGVLRLDERGRPRRRAA